MRTWLLLIFFSPFSFAQESDILTFADYLRMVRDNHPAVRSAGLLTEMGEAGLTSARGAFDPKVESGFSEKDFKGTEYYILRDGALKIPTWYGVELKAGFENHDGDYLNPQNTVPDRGLNAFGINIPLGQGMLINQRMADLRNARLQLSMNRQERVLMAANIVGLAAEAYVKWQNADAERDLYRRYVEMANRRFDGILKVVQAGERASIDSIEASVIKNSRLLSLEQAELKLAKARLELSVFLWAENNVPLELGDRTRPEKISDETVSMLLGTQRLMEPSQVAAHPKIRLMQDKIEILDNDRRLKANSLLPKFDLGYSYLTEHGFIDSGSFSDHKIGFEFSFPLFLRKERGNLRLAKLKIRDAENRLELEKVELSNKIKANILEIASLKKQQSIARTMLREADALRQAEEKLFTFGESSLFLVNNRENSHIAAELANISVDARLFLAHAALYRESAVFE